MPADRIGQGEWYVLHLCHYMAYRPRINKNRGEITPQGGNDGATDRGLLTRRDAPVLHGRNDRMAVAGNSIEGG